MTAMRIIYIGMPGVFSVIPLGSLLTSGHQVAGVLTPARSGPERRARIPLIQPSGLPALIDLAGSHHIPVFAADDPRDPALLSSIRELRPDVILAACYPRRLPPALVALARFGGFNLHPSLLPRYRGPAPLFWQFYYGEQATGISLHQLTERIDAGAIAGQSRVDLDEGSSHDAAARVLAGHGSKLMQTLLSEFAGAGPTLVAQDETKASYHPWPSVGDFRLSTKWTAKRAYNFMCATRDWGHRFTIEINHQTHYLRQALAYDARQRLDQACVRQDGHLLIQFNPGVLLAEPAT